MKLRSPTVVPEELLDQCREILDGIAPGSSGIMDLEKGDDPKLIKRAMHQLRPLEVRVYRAKNDGDAALRVKLYSDAEVAARTARPKRKAKAKK